MNLTRQIFENLNESERINNKIKKLREAEVKKPYGETPEEGKAEAKVKASKGVKIGNKVQNTAPVKPLENKNKEAGDVYANDTDKYNDNINNKNHTDKGNIAKKNTKKAEKTVKVPYGDKVDTPSDNKLIKENEEFDDTEIKEGENCDNNEELLNEKIVVGDEEYGNVDQGSLDAVQNSILELLNNKCGEASKIEGNKVILDESKYISCVVNEDGINVSLCSNDTILSEQKISFSEVIENIKNL